MAKWGEIKCTNCTALEERLEAAQRDAKEAEAYAEELERKLANEAVLSKAAYEGVSSLLLSVQQDCIKERQRAERLEAALKWQAEQPEAHPFMVAHARTALAELTSGEATTPVGQEGGKDE